MHFMRFSCVGLVGEEGGTQYLLLDSSRVSRVVENTRDINVFFTAMIAQANIGPLFEEGEPLFQPSL
jgi:hypothetical protein